MNEIEYYRMQEDAAIGEDVAAKLKAILDNWGVENVRQLDRAIYDGTDCGAHLSVKLHNGTWRHSGDLDGIDNGNVQALSLGSIVEGSDAEITSPTISLLNYINEEGDEQRLIADFDKTIEWVNREACALWEEANNDC